MKNPFSALMVRFRKKSQSDGWEGRTVIDHIEYAQPDPFIVNDLYYHFTEKDFEGVVERAKESIPKLDLPEDCSGLFRPLLQTREMWLLSVLNSVRLDHAREAVHLRTECEQQLREKQLYISEMQAELEKIDRQLEELEGDGNG